MLLSSLYKITDVIKIIDSSIEFDISIIVPVFNREQLIVNCIKSINSQTLNKSRFEVIFIDDSSTDKSSAVIEYHISPDINWHIVRRNIPSGNASTPRNEGIKAAKGRYIFFLDSDDTIHSDLLLDGIQIADKNNSDIVYFKQTSSTGRGIPVRAFKKGANKADINKNHLFRSLRVSKLFKKKILIDNAISFNPSLSVFEDILFSCHALTVSDTISVLADKDYYSLNSHGQSHLSKVAFPIEHRILVLQYGITYIVLSKKKKIEKVKMFTAWLIICLEHLSSIIKTKSLSNEHKEIYFKIVYKSLSTHSELINMDFVYKNFQYPAQLLLNDDYDIFRETILTTTRNK